MVAAYNFQSHAATENGRARDCLIASAIASNGADAA
jgi:hypothetical protein